MKKMSFLLPGAGLEPARALRPLAPQASASASSATPAYFITTWRQVASAPPDQERVVLRLVFGALVAQQV